MIFKQLFDQDSWTYTYLLADPVTRAAIIIDPVVEKVERDLKLIAELWLELIYTLDTHVHADHVTGSGKLRERTGAHSVASAASAVGCADRSVQHGDRLRFGLYNVEVRSTPGHTDGCVTYVVEDNGQTMAFTGDALFIRGSGRTDFHQGDAKTLYHSVHNQIFTLPDNALIYPGHDYRGHTSSTVAEEKAHNPRLNVTVSESQFVEIMNGLNLADPKLMDMAVPANLACGRRESIEPHTDSSVRELTPGGVDDVTRYRVVDVRQPHEFNGDLGHIDHAEMTPLDLLEDQARTWRREEALLLVCRSGQRSSKACDVLAQMGFSDVTNLSGGMLAWNERVTVGAGR